MSFLDRVYAYVYMKGTEKEKKPLHHATKENAVVQQFDHKSTYFFWQLSETVQVLKREVELLRKSQIEKHKVRV